MRIGVGLPTTVPGGMGAVTLEWARLADERPFSSLGVLDRVAYQSLDPFLALTAAASVTSRVRLATMVAVGPIRPAAVLAKQAASLHQVSSGRLVLGLSIGARLEDYQAAGVDPRGRGRVLTEQLEAIRSHWEARDVTPGPEGAPPSILVGGLAGASFLRMARGADGYAHGGGPPRAFARAAVMARTAWTDLRRPGRPELWGQGYFALGEEHREEGAAYLRHYYAFTGPFAEKVAAANLTTPQAIKDFVRGYEDAGCDELVLFPTVADPSQVERLADSLW
ncbi:MAG TPA: LLM class flavin-dependent oxidoreductase [Actinomycetota bacterium]|nr:LLM class flavin-dependent oxidoreductase [Actinomycetota bacterium]